MSLALIVIALIVVAFQTLAENVISPKSTSLPGLRKTSSLSVPEAGFHVFLSYFLSTETRRAIRYGESSWVILWDAKYMCTLLEHMKHNFL